MTRHAPLSLEAVFARAKAEADVPEFDTACFVPALRKFIESVNGALDLLHDKGRKGIEDWVVRLLVNRLRLQRDIERHPEILSETLLPPAAIIGLPRTGSTKLQRMLAAGRGFQEPLMWQVFNPAPFPGPAAEECDLRIQAAAEFVASVARDAPASHNGHRMVVEQAEEESHLLEQGFETPTTISFVPVFSWCRYIERLDKTETYLHLRKCLQYLQWQFHRDDLKPWLLKYPANLGNESYISRTFPGVRYVVTHRKPFAILASLSRLIGETQLVNCSGYDVQRISRWALEEFSSQMERHMAWREANPGAAILDVSFKEIVENGFDTARRIYDFLETDWTPQAQAEVRKWLDENEQQKDKLIYSFEDIAFTEDECREKFRDYYRNFSDFI